MQPRNEAVGIIRCMTTERGQIESPTRLSHEQERLVVERARRGCEMAARELVDGHKDRLFAFVGRVIRNHHDVEEICQAAFQRAFAKLETFSAEYRFSTWLFTIAYRLCLNLLRRKRALSGEVDFSGIASPHEEGQEELASSEEAARLKTLVWDAVDGLSTVQRASVILFYRESLSCQEIGEILEMPTATVKSHLHRARLRLKEKLAPMAGADWNQLDVFQQSA